MEGGRERLGASMSGQFGDFCGMNFLGIFLAIGCIVTTMVLEGTHPTALINLPAFLVVFGAGFFACFVQFPLSDLLKALKQSGVLLLLATGKGPECCQITLEHWGLQDMFAATCCGGPDRLNKAEHLKGLMAQFHLAPADLCYIGDALSDFTACAAVGVRCLSALWQSDAQDRDELVRLNGPYCFDSVQACAAYVYSNCPALQEYQTAGYFVKSIAKTVN